MMIVYTRVTDGGVSIIVPSLRCLAAMCNGGGATCDGDPWETPERGFLAKQIERRVRIDGQDPDAARRFVLARAFGGCTTAEALELMRLTERYIIIQRAAEVWDEWLGPADRWFRNAWQRSQNGGPIWIDLEQARGMQAAHIRVAYHDHKKRAENDDLDSRLMGRLTNGPGIEELEAAMWGARIAAARSPEELRAVWPEWLPLCRPKAAMTPASISSFMKGTHH